jgi:hypothetical protein
MAKILENMGVGNNSREQWQRTNEGSDIRGIQIKRAIADTEKLPRRSGDIYSTSFKNFPVPKCSRMETTHWWEIKGVKR